MKKFLHIHLTGFFLLTTGLFYIGKHGLHLSNLASHIFKYFSSIPNKDYTQFDLQPYTGILYFYLALSSIIGGFIYIVLANKISYYIQVCIILFKKAILFFKNLPPSYKTATALLVIINVLLKGFLLLQQPVFVDEAWTYLMFTQKSFLTSLSYYPAPNNHILFSLLTNISTLLPVNTLTALRLPAFLLNISVILSFIIVFGKLFTPKTAIFLAYIFSFGFAMIYYGYIARGYMLYLWAFLILFYIAIQFLKRQEFTTNYYCLWLMASVTGFWAIPAFLYPYASIVIFLTLYLFKFKYYQSLKKFVFLNLITVFSVIWIYLPVLLVSGYKALIANPYVTSMPHRSVLRHFFKHFNDTSWLLFNMPVLVTFVIFIGLVIFFKRNKWNTSVIFAFYLILTAPFIMLLHATVPAPRIWIYWLIPVFYLLGIILETHITNPLNNKILVKLAGLLILIQTGFFFYRIKTYNIESYEAKKMTAYLMKQNVDNIYFGKDTYLGASIVFNYLNRHKTINYKQCFKNQDINDFENFKWFIFRYPPSPDTCRQLGLTPLNIITRKGSCHFLYRKINNEH